MPARAFLFGVSRAGCFHVVNRVDDRRFLLDAEGKEFLVKPVRAYEDARLFSLSEFMKAIQLRFSRGYNLRAGRKGAFWEGRHTSVFVQEEERGLRTMAAYIDLNPVRAGRVADPAEYRWSGYSEAMAGKARSRRGGCGSHRPVRMALR